MRSCLHSSDGIVGKSGNISLVLHRSSLITPGHFQIPMPFFSCFEFKMAWQKTRIRGHILLIKIAYFTSVTDCVEKYLQFNGVKLPDLHKI